MQTALKYLGEQDTWNLEILVQLKPEVDYRREPILSWWNWNHFYTLCTHVAARAAPKGLFNSLWNNEYGFFRFGLNSWWINEYDFFRFEILPSLLQHRLRLAKEAASRETAQGANQDGIID